MTEINVCPIHGRQKSFIRLDCKDYCFKCIADKFDELGICQLEQVSVDDEILMRD